MLVDFYTLILRTESLSLMKRYVYAVRWHPPAHVCLHVLGFALIARKKCTCYCQERYYPRNDGGFAETYGMAEHGSSFDTNLTI